MTPSISPISRALAALAVALVCIGVGAQSAIGGGGNGGGGQKTEKLGKTNDTPTPNCPETEQYACNVTGQVTGYQKSADGKKGLFKVRADGHIVAWSVDLADPSKEERKTFGNASQTDQYGKAPTAGISIISRQQDKEFKLKGASPILNVRGFYGEKPVFTLDQPLAVKEGDIVALTTATWLPSFSTKEQTANDIWIGSRKEEDWENGSECTIPSNVPADEQIDYFFDHSSPHRKVGSVRPYECKYNEARILYWAYFVKD